MDVDLLYKRGVDYQYKTQLCLLRNKRELTTAYSAKPKQNEHDSNSRALQGYIRIADDLVELIQ